MANKFTKSVLERQAIEAKRQKGQESPSPAPVAEAAAAQPVAAPAQPPMETLDAPVRVALRDDGAPAYTLSVHRTEPTVQEELPQDNEAEPQNSVMQNGLSDLVAAYVIRTPERVAKNKTFYLDEAVITAVRAAAKRQKVTESKLVNDILRGVLGIH